MYSDSVAMSAGLMPLIRAAWLCVSPLLWDFCAFCARLSGPRPAALVAASPHALQPAALPARSPQPQRSAAWRIHARHNARSDLSRQPDCPPYATRDAPMPRCYTAQRSCTMVQSLSCRFGRASVPGVQSMNSDLPRSPTVLQPRRSPLASSIPSIVRRLPTTYGTRQRQSVAVPALCSHWPKHQQRAGDR